MSNRIYEAAVYSQTVSYRNFKGVENTVELFFALDPLQLMQILSTYEPKKIKSGNPAIAGKDAPLSSEEQLGFVRKLASQAAGNPSDDGESWEHFEQFDETLVGKAFLTKLAASDVDRREFSNQVILEPFRAFIGYAVEDSGNSPADVAEFKDMLVKVEKLFIVPEKAEETQAEKKARLAAEMAALENDQEG